MNRMGSSSRITKEVKDVIYKIWKAEQDDLAKEPGKKLNIKKLLDEVNKEVRKKNLRMEAISKSQLYVEIKAFQDKKDEIETEHPFLEQPFNLGTFLREYGKEAAVDGEGIDAILRCNDFQDQYFEPTIFTNRRALWVARLQHLMYNKMESVLRKDEEGNIAAIDEYYYIGDVDLVADTYARMELYSEITGQPFDTSILDNALLLKDWQPEFKKMMEQLEKGDERYRNYIEAINRKYPKKTGGTK